MPRAVHANRRAPRSEGPRTTLRVPTELTETADLLAQDLQISRNDALLRLASRGAQIYREERTIAERREARWASIVPGSAAVGGEFPSPEEARDAVLGARVATAD